MSKLNVFIVLLLLFLYFMIFDVYAGYEFTVSKTGDGNGTITHGSLIDCGNKCKVTNYEKGTGLELHANPNPTSYFVEWTGGCENPNQCYGPCTGINNICYTTVYQSSWANAKFNLKTNFTFLKTGEGSGEIISNPQPSYIEPNCNNDCDNYYMPGYSVTLEAIPHSTSIFTGWSGACSGNQKICMLKTNNKAQIIANFDLKKTLTLSKYGNGKIVSNPGGIDCGNTCNFGYAINSLITLRATPDSNNVFLEWTGACTGTKLCKLTLDSDKEVKAIFLGINNRDNSNSKCNGVEGDHSGLQCIEGCKTNTWSTAWGISNGNCLGNNCNTGSGCCGDDKGEYLITTGTRTACCKSPDSYVDSNGNCLDKNSYYSVNICPSDEIKILELSSPENAHASYDATYTNYLCLKKPGYGLKTSYKEISNDFKTYTKLVSLSNDKNAHASFTTDALQGYNNIYIGSTLIGQAIQCRLLNGECSSIGENSFCVLSLSDYKNAHVGDCNAYSNKICCSIAGNQITENCFNGIDDDGNSRIDCQDFSCQGQFCKEDSSMVCESDSYTQDQSICKNSCCKIIPEKDWYKTDCDYDTVCGGNGAKCIACLGNNCNNIQNICSYSSNGKKENEYYYIGNPKPCEDGIDNDGDAISDSSDPDCFGSLGNNNQQTCNLNLYNSQSCVTTQSCYNLPSNLINFPSAEGVISDCCGNDPGEYFKEILNSAGEKIRTCCNKQDDVLDQNGNCVNTHDTCGDNLVQTGELCDGTNLKNLRCQSFGYSSGNLKCKPDCTSFVFDECSGGIPRICGNGIVEYSETCDKEDLKGKTCQSFGYSSGNLKCKDDCKDYDKSQCIGGNPYVCGNNRLDPNEECDGNFFLAGKSCLGYGYNGGSLRCNNQCKITTNECFTSNLPQLTLSSQLTSNQIIIKWQNSLAVSRSSLIRRTAAAAIVKDTLTGNLILNNKNVLEEINNYIKNLFTKKIIGQEIIGIKGYKINRYINNVKNPAQTIVSDNPSTIPNTMQISCSGNLCTLTDNSQFTNANEVKYEVFAYNDKGDGPKKTVSIAKPTITDFIIEERLQNNQVKLKISTENAYQCRFANSQTNIATSQYENYNINKLFTNTGTGQSEIYVQCKNILGESQATKLMISAKPENEYQNGCNNNLDDDNDGILDGLDKDCAIGEKVTIKQASVQDSNVLDNSEFELSCKIELTLASQNPTASPFRAEPCVLANITYNQETEKCIFKERTNDVLKFKCNSGVNAQGKKASCYINTDKCNSDLEDITKTYAETSINVVYALSLCPRIIGLERLNLVNVDLENKNYEHDELAFFNVILRNLESKNSDIIVESYLYNIKQELARTSLTKAISSLNQEIFNLNLTIPKVTTDNNRFKLYFKIYLKDQPNEICLESSKDININKYLGTEINNQTTDDESGETIGENASCSEGETQECGTDVGICRKGTQICSNDLWGECVDEVKPKQEACSNKKDDDCDGLTDCSDDDCSENAKCKKITEQNLEDSDEDGLPDEWEMQYFGDLEQGADDDFNDDGITHLEEYEQDKNPTKSAKTKSSSSTLLIIIIVVFVLLAAGLIIWKFTKKPKSNLKQGSQKMNNVNMVLLNHVKNSLSKGYSREQIKTALLAKGWNKKDIEEVFGNV